MSGAESAPTCSQCGGNVPAGSAECPECGRKGSRPASSRQAAVLLSLTLLAALFLLTGFMSRLFLRHEAGLGEQWYQKGQADFAAGRPEAAVEALHNALAYSKDNAVYELRLAQALIAAGRAAEAESYLRTLHESQPGNAPVDLELARLAAKRGDITEAVRYYVAGIYGVWDANGEQRRRQTHLELIAFLTEHNRPSEALAQTMSFAANLPPDASLRIKAGSLFLAEKSYDHAEEEFCNALRLDPGNQQALAGAGRALFEAGKLTEALPLLERAHRADPQDAAVEQMLQLSRAVIALDPSLPGLSSETRAKRALRSFQLAENRLAACFLREPGAAKASLADWNRQILDLKPKVKEKALLRNLELFEAAVKVALESESQAAAVCGPGSVEDQALALLARRRAGGAR